jgi:DNA-directed RNA polymerase specialized sigma24 family protein
MEFPFLLGRICTAGFSLMEPGSSSAGLFVTEDRYYRLRARLVVFFERRAPAFAEDLADDSLKRTVQLLTGRTEIQSEEVAKLAFGVAKKLALEAYRQPRHSSLEGVEPAAPDMQFTCQAERARAAVGTLHPEDRELMEQYYVDGRRAEAMAKDLGLSPEGVRSRIFRKRKLLLRQLSRDIDGGGETKAGGETYEDDRRGRD